MGIMKFGLVAAFAASTLAVAMPAAAKTEIKNAADCAFEGGGMINVKGTDFCLIAIRPAEYAGPEYDGNQLGVVECPGDKLNDGKYCMYPVTIRPEIGKEPVRMDDKKTEKKTN